jgi:hypothetical protein
MKMSHLDENKAASVNQLLKMCSKKITTMSSIHFYGNLSNIQFLPNVDNKMKSIHCYGIMEELDIPILMHFLASPRADGQQRVMNIQLLFEPAVPKLLDAIKEVWKLIWPYIFVSLSIFCRISVHRPNQCHNHFVSESKPIFLIFPQVERKTCKPMKH